MARSFSSLADEQPEFMAMHVLQRPTLERATTYTATSSLLSFSSEGYDDLSKVELGSIDQSARYDENTTIRASFDGRMPNDSIREDSAFAPSIPALAYKQGGTVSPLSIQSPFYNIIGLSSSCDKISISSGVFTSVGSRGCSRICIDTPNFIMRTHFRCSTRSVEEIEEIIRSFLACYPHLSFEYDKEYYKWILVLSQGSTRAKIEIHIYEDDVIDSCYIIETNKLSGSADLLYMLFNDLKSRFGKKTNDDVSDFKKSESFSSDLPGMVIESASVSMEMLMPIFNMASSGSNLEESSSILCDLSFHHSAQEILCTKECLAIFSEMLTSANKLEQKNVQSNIILALFNFSEAPSFQSLIIASGIVPQLLRLCVDGSYDTCEMRRNCTCLVANLATSVSNDFVSCFNHVEYLKEWLESLDSITDAQLKIHALRIKNSLTNLAF